MLKHQKFILIYLIFLNFNQFISTSVVRNQNLLNNLKLSTDNDIQSTTENFQINDVQTDNIEGSNANSFTDDPLKSLKINNQNDLFNFFDNQNYQIDNKDDLDIFTDNDLENSIYTTPSTDPSSRFEMDASEEYDYNENIYLIIGIITVVLVGISILIIELKRHCCPNLDCFCIDFCFCDHHHSNSGSFICFSDGCCGNDTCTGGCCTSECCGECWGCDGGCCGDDCCTGNCGDGNCCEDDCCANGGLCSDEFCAQDCCVDDCCANGDCGNCDCGNCDCGNVDFSGLDCSGVDCNC